MKIYDDNELLTREEQATQKKLQYMGIGFFIGFFMCALFVTLLMLIV